MDDFTAGFLAVVGVTGIGIPERSNVLN